MPPEVAIVPSTPAVCRSPWSRAAALGAWGLAGLQTSALVTPVSYTHLTLPTICSV